MPAPRPRRLQHRAEVAQHAAVGTAAAGGPPRAADTHRSMIFSAAVRHCIRHRRLLCTSRVATCPRTQQNRQQSEDGHSSCVAAPQAKSLF